MRYIDTEGNGHTMLILMDAESRLIRRHLEASAEYFESEHCRKLVSAWSSGVARATERMRAEEKAGAKAKRERKQT